MKSWFTLFSGAVVVSGIAAMLSFAASVLVLRLLSLPDTGDYVLLSSLAGLISVGGYFGQATFLNRTYARSETTHNWQKDLLGTYLYCAPLLVAATLVVIVLYQLGVFESFFVISTVLLDGLAMLCAWMLNSQRHYSWSSLLLRLANILLILPVGWMILAWHTASLYQVLTAQIIIDLLCAVAGLLLMNRLMPAGEKTLKVRERWQSGIFGIMIFSTLIYDPGLAAVGGYFVADAPLAAIGAYLTLARPFAILQTLLVQTLSVEVVRDRTFPRGKTSLAITLGGALLTIGAVILLPLISHALFSGRYDDFSALALPFALAGGLMLTECMPRSAILGLGNPTTINQYALGQLAITLVVIAVEIGLVLRVGVIGIGWAATVIYLLRNLLSYRIYFNKSLYNASVS